MKSQKRYEDLLAAGAPNLEQGYFYEIRRSISSDTGLDYEVALFEGDKFVDSTLIFRLTIDEIVKGCKDVVKKRKDDLERKRREEEWLGRY